LSSARQLANAKAKGTECFWVNATTTLLYIDDQTCRSRLLVQNLRKADYEVYVAPDEDEAIGLFRLYPVDAAVMNCHVDSTHEEPIAPVLRRIRPDVPIIMLSGYCPSPCAMFKYADACVQRGDSNAVLEVLPPALCARSFGLVQSLAA
jgi:ActR/RegA family two-component response regulator